MKFTKSQLKQIIKEEVNSILNEEAQSWSDIIIDKAVSEIIESTYDYDPPQDMLDALEGQTRDLLMNIKPMLDQITGR